ncbi:MAG TPA: response regulator, partial [Candidatus Didemnitutus sp.]|nr:response regulator [Candidatus Didemnitutus sp.]
SIVMLTAFGREEIRDEAERLGLDGFLVKPVTKSMVVDALVNIYANSGDQAAAVSEATGEGVSLAGMRLLLVEDNEINRQIAVELLEGVGAQVAIATNGREAVDKIFDGPVPPPFDAILMDLQMPEMDGYQATARIRSDSRLAGLPIVAMTAHATIEERQNCLAAGMNDHIAKPIDPGVLFATLAHFHKPPSAAERSAPPPASPAPAVPGSADGELPAIDGLDTADGLSRVAGNRKLYLKLLRQFRDGQNTAVAQTKAALESGDTATAERLAHTLKGVAGNLGAKPVQAAAAKLEKLIHDRAASSQIETAVTAAAAELEPLLARLRAALPDATTAAGGPTIVSIDPTATRAIAEQLAKMLNDFDAGAVDFAEANEASLRPAFEADAWEKFMQHTQGFAFTDAQALLEAAMRKNGA